MTASIHSSRVFAAPDLDGAAAPDSAGRPAANEAGVCVAALYGFARLDDPAGLVPALREACATAHITGTLLLAHEGVNGTITGSDAAIAAIVARLRAIDGLERLDVKLSRTSAPPFRRLKFKVKSEIVTMGVEGIDPLTDAGTYVAPADWNRLILDPETIVVDTRNDYEVAIGTFRGAIDPETASFREFPAWAEANLSAARDRPIAMFCTGGIRCEKATALLKTRGFERVYHLRGGILKYLEDVPAHQSLWDGDCFVFDDRVSVGHGLTQGRHVLCRACGHPIAVGVGDQGGGFAEHACAACAAKAASA